MLLFLLGSLNVWGDPAAAGTTLFSENFGGYSNTNIPSGSVFSSTGNRVVYGGGSVTYTCTDGMGTSAGTTKVTTDNSGNLAGGASPELMVGKKGSGTGAAGGSFSIAGIPSGGAQKITVSFKQNKQNLSVSVSGNGYVGSISGKPDAAGERNFDVTVTDGAAATFTLTFQAATTSNVRVDDILVTVKTAGGGGTLSHTWDLSTNSYKYANTDQVTWSSDDDDNVENDVVKMIVEKDKAETAANDYLGGDANSHTSSRFYQNSILKIIHRYDVTVTSVVFTATTEADATALQESDWTNVADATASGTTVTVTPNDPVGNISAPIRETCDFTRVTVNYTDASAEPEPVIVKKLKSIAVEGMTTTFEQGDVFNFDGTCTATYSVTKDDVPQADETKTVTPTSVSTPDMSTTGEKEITVTYTENEVTKTASYNITVSAALPKFIIDGEPLTTTATTEATTKTYTGTDGSSTVNIVFSDGAKKQAVGTGAVNNFSSNPAILIGKKGKNIHNSTPFPGKITKFELYYNKGAANGTSISVTFSTTPLTEAATSGDNLYTVTFTDDTYKDKVYDCTSKVPEGALYFWYQVTSNSNSQVQFRVTYEANPTAPSVTIDPTAISLATPDAANGTIDATYENITLASVTVGRYSDAECTEAFTGDWLEATLNGDKDIEYTIAANTGAARTAYIKLTAPASNGTSPDVVKIIEVSQAKGIPTYTALNAIFAAATGTNETVNITFDNWVISAVKGNNAYLTDGTYGLIIYTEGHGFEVGNVLSGTAQTLLKLYQGNAQLSGLMTTTTGLTVTTGGTVTARVLDTEAAAELTGANAGSLIKISGECTKESSK